MLPAQWNLQIQSDTTLAGSFSTIAKDPRGNLLAGGYFEQDWKTQTEVWSARGASDAYVASYDTSGSIRWARRISGPGVDRVWSVASDSAGNVVAAGYTEGGFSFGPTMVNMPGVFAARFRPDGRPLSWIDISLPRTGEPQSINLEINGIGQIFVTVQWLDDEVPYTVLVRVKDVGSILEAQQRFEVRDSLRGADTRVMPSGRIWLGGAALTPDGERATLREYDRSGDLRRTVRATGGFSHIQGITADFSGHLLATGSFEDTLHWGDRQVHSEGNRDMFIARLDSTGVPRWVRSAGSGGSDGGIDVAADTEGNAYLLGTFSGKMEIGDFVLETDQAHEQFLAKYDSLGVLLWAIRLGWLYETGNSSDALPLDLQAWQNLTDLVQVSGLSVLFSAFDAEWIPRGEDVCLVWETQLEINSFRFVVERSLDGTAWETVGEHPAAGVSFNPISYERIDENPNPAAQEIYYRLRLIDIFGEAVWSETIRFTREDPGTSNIVLRVFPNPTQDWLTVLLPPDLSEAGMELELFDISGRRYFYEVALTPGSEHVLDLRALRPGHYYLRVSFPGSRWTATAPVLKW
ncbi:MAG: hypothetical protein OHK0039_29750 [Bacteroidia bacterium]